MAPARSMTSIGLLLACSAMASAANLRGAHGRQLSLQRQIYDQLYLTIYPTVQRPDGTGPTGCASKYYELSITSETSQWSGGAPLHTFPGMENEPYPDAGSYDLNDISYKEYSWHLCKDTEGGANVERSGACCANTKTLAVAYQIAEALTAKVDLVNAPYPASASFDVTETITGTKTINGKDSALGPVTFAMQYSIDCPQLAWDHTKKENGGIWDIRECYSNDKGVAITGKITLSGAISKSILIALPGTGQDSGMVLKHGEFSNATL